MGTYNLGVETNIPFGPNGSPVSGIFFWGQLDGKSEQIPTGGRLLPTEAPT